MLVHRGRSSIWCVGVLACFVCQNSALSRTDGSLTLFSPIDPIYLAISYLSALPSRFQSYQDLWESITQHRFEVQGSKEGKNKNEEGEEDEAVDYAEDLGSLGAMECVQERLKTVCETQSAF